MSAALFIALGSRYSRVGKVLESIVSSDFEIACDLIYSKLTCKITIVMLGGRR